PEATQFPQVMTVADCIDKKDAPEPVDPPALPTPAGPGMQPGSKGTVEPLSLPPLEWPLSPQAPALPNGSSAFFYLDNAPKSGSPRPGSRVMNGGRAASGVPDGVGDPAALVARRLDGALASAAAPGARLVPGARQRFRWRPARHPRARSA